MTKLEQKLVELGYEKTISNEYVKFKYYPIKIVIFPCVLGGTLQFGTILNIYNQKQLDDFKYDLQQAFNEMQKDLEILKNIDNLNEETNSQRELANKLWEKDVKHMRELGEWERKQWDY